MLNEEIVIVIKEEFAKLVGSALLHQESVFSDKVQRESNKRVLEKSIYNCRNAICARLGIGDLIERN